jgi:hypothetical protein
MIATFGVIFAIQARFSEQRPLDLALRCGLGLLALVVLFTPDDQVAALVSLPVLAMIGYWIMQRRRGAVPLEKTA